MIFCARILLVMIIILFLALFAVAFAHSWYPPECCSDSDCYPLPEGSVIKAPGGYLLEGGEFVPDALTKEGKDGRYHVCRHPFPKVICFFKPFHGV
jgi:hypothetical protein